MIQYYVMRVQKEVLTMVSLTKRLSYFLMSMMLIVMTVFNTGLTVNAATTCTGSATALVIPKFLVMKENAAVPDASFTFTIASGAEVAATPTSPHIVPGPAGAVLTNGTDTAASVNAVFAPGDTVWTTVQGSDPLNLSTGNQYAKKDITVDLSGVTFTEPGVYRWTITESGTVAGIANDTATTRYLDVYIVTDTDGNLSVAPNGYVIHKTTDVFTDGSKPSDLPSNSEDTTVTGGNSSFINKAATFDYTIKHTTTGNQGYHGKYFKYTVTITNGIAGGYTVDLTNATSSPVVNGTPQTNPTTITTTATYYLKHNESIVIKNIAETASVEVSVVKEDYIAKYDLNSAGQVTADTMPATLVGAQSNTLVWELNRAGTVPTGVFLNMMPWPILLLIAAAFLAYSQWRKARNRSQLM